VEAYDEAHSRIENQDARMRKEGVLRNSRESFYIAAIQISYLDS
jgi:hypothetical protein